MLQAGIFSQISEVFYYVYKKLLHIADYVIAHLR